MIDCLLQGPHCNQCRAWSGPLETEEEVASKAAQGKKRKNQGKDSSGRKSATLGLVSIPRFKKKRESSSSRDHDDRNHREGSSDHGDYSEHDERDRRDRDSDRDSDKRRDSDRDRDWDRSSDRGGDYDRRRSESSDTYRRDSDKRRTPPRSPKRYRWEDVFPSNSTSSSTSTSSTTSSSSAGSYSSSYSHNPPYASQSRTQLPGLPPLPTVQSPRHSGSYPTAGLAYGASSHSTGGSSSTSDVYNPAFPSNATATSTAPSPHSFNKPPHTVAAQPAATAIQHYGQYGAASSFNGVAHTSTPSVTGFPTPNTPVSAATTAAVIKASLDPRQKEDNKSSTNGSGNGSVNKDEKPQKKEKLSPVSSEKKFRKVVGTYVVKYLKKYLQQVPNIMCDDPELF